MLDESHEESLQEVEKKRVEYLTSIAAVSMRPFARSEAPTAGLMMLGARQHPEFRA